MMDDSRRVDHNKREGEEGEGEGRRRGGVVVRRVVGVAGRE